MIFCVFSFNRGQFLRNCIKSIETCAPQSEIVVFDDYSDDPETTDVLRQIKVKHRVMQPRHSSRHHLGGLYGNMQSALEYCKNKELVCYLQDDTQIVRSLDEQDYFIINKAFDELPDLGFLHPCFMKGINKDRLDCYIYEEDSRLYFRGPTQRSSGRFFSAMLIMKPKRVLEKGWQFQSSEPLNNRQAEALFQPMGYLFSPFAMWLPDVPAYRGKRKTLGLKLAEKKRGCGYFPFREMTANQIKSFRNRPASTLPVAEDYLSCQTAAPSSPWAYYPLTGTGWMKALHKLELNMRKIF